MSKRKKIVEEVIEPVEEAVIEATDESNADAGAEPEMVVDSTYEEPTPEVDADAYVEDDARVTAGHNSKHEHERDRARLLSDIGKLGKVNGLGKSSLVGLAERLVNASADEIAVPEDAAKFYQKFRKASAEAAGKNSADEQSAASESANVSKLKKFLEVGGTFVGKDPWATVFEYARDVHVQAMASADKKLLRTKGTYETLVNVARRQMDRPSALLTTDEIDKIIWADDADKQEKTAIDLVKDGLKKLEQARDGKKASGDNGPRQPLNHGNLDDAIAHCWEVLREFDPEFVAKAQAKAQAPEQEALALEAQAA